MKKMDVYFESFKIGCVENMNTSYPVYFKKIHKVNDDLLRGFLIWNKNIWSFQQPIKSENKKKSILLLLESPHKDEYQQNSKSKNSSIIPIRPANGRTGKTIETKIKNRPWLSYLNKQDVYQIFILNSIQYQCSCYNYIQNLLKIDPHLRDEVFKLFWNWNVNDTYIFQKCLIKRISSCNPNLIVNACTGMTEKNKIIVPKSKSLSEMVENVVKPYAIENKIPYICDFHPATCGKQCWK